MWNEHFGIGKKFFLILKKEKYKIVSKQTFSYTFNNLKKQRGFGTKSALALQFTNNYFYRIFNILLM